MQLQALKHSIDISDLTCWYQPIYDVKNNILLGYEALMRSENQNALNPMEIFRKAQLFGEHTLLDRHLIIKAQQLFRGLKDYSLFINIFPSTLLEEDFIFWWDNHSEKLPNIVLELSESEPISDWQSVKFVLKQLRDRNIRIAIDDLGQGHSSLQHWIELEPEYIKIDRYYMMDIIRNEKKQRIIEGLIKMLCDSTQLIFEGIEDIETLKTAKDLGVSCAQGYLLGMPSPVINIGPMVLLENSSKN